MNLLSELQARFQSALADMVPDPAVFAGLVRPTADSRFGDYQANLAMPLGKLLGKPPREVAAEVVVRLKVDDLCEPPEIAGPGFINLRVKDQFLSHALSEALTSDRLGVAAATNPRTYVVDYSAPNVAKPMHVGHIRSTVIGDALARTLRFLGQRVITDNHIGDWGTQFGMIIYGYKNFLDPAAYKSEPVTELSRLYRLVNRVVSYHENRAAIEPSRNKVALAKSGVDKLKAQPASGDKAADKEAAKALRKAETNLQSATSELASLERSLAEVESDAALAPLAKQHADIGRAVLAETAKLHQGDAENLRLWHEFLPPCLADIERIYKRLGVHFDHTLGESYYHDRLAPVADELEQRKIAQVSEGALCIFLPGQEAPMLIRKKDGAFLYATSDLATIQYRVETWHPDAVLYVVDHRQSLHFEHLFAAAKLWGYQDLELAHVSFGTVLGEDGRPFKTRSGDSVGLWGLLDEAVERALAVISQQEDSKPAAHKVPTERRQEIAEAVGIGALKYADLAQNRTSDYTFSYDRMLAMNGNTATYMQYAYARVSSIFAKGDVDAESVRTSNVKIDLLHPAERALGLALLQFSEALADTVAEYRPNFLTGYLYALANRYSTFFEECPVLKAQTPQSRASRLALCDLTARTLRQGLELLGIQVVERM